MIFLTTSTDFAVEAFALHVVDYLKKPYTEQRLTDTLDRVIQKRNKRLFTPIQCGKETVRIDLYTVLYAESRSSGVEIHLNTGEVLHTRTTLARFWELFEKATGFVLAGASYLVNFRGVQSLHQTTLEMMNGDIIPIPRRLRSELKIQYFGFYRKEAMEL